MSSASARIAKEEEKKKEEEARKAREIREKRKLGDEERKKMEEEAERISQEERDADALKNLTDPTPGEKEAAEKNRTGGIL